MLRARDPNVAHNDLPALPPSQDVETKDILKLAIEARAALATLSQAANSMVNPTVLINTIPLLEAQSSSEIENIVTTTDDLFAGMVSESVPSSATREALRYRQALREGFDLVKERRVLTSLMTLNICSTIKNHRLEIRSDTGTYIGDPFTSTRRYTPPKANLFLNRNSASGNPSSMYELLDFPVLNPSEYLIETKNEYYDKLLAVTAKDNWGEWVSYILEGVRKTTINTHKRIRKISRLQEDLTHDVIEALPRGGHPLLATVFFEQPY